MKNILTIFGATIMASLCCITPVLALLAGSSSMVSYFSWLETYHNYLVIFTILVLLYAWYDKLKPSRNIECACCPISRFFSSKKFLAIVTFFVISMLSFPQWGNKVFNIAPPSCSSCLGMTEQNNQ